jgi:hypothetical protein
VDGLEITSQPDRLDLPDALVHAAVRADDSDAHAPSLGRTHCRPAPLAWPMSACSGLERNEAAVLVQRTDGVGEERRTWQNLQPWRQGRRQLLRSRHGVEHHDAIEP